MSDIDFGLPLPATLVAKAVLRVAPSETDVSQALAGGAALRKVAPRLEPVPTIALHRYPELERCGFRVENDGAGHFHIFFGQREVSRGPSGVSGVVAYQDRLIVPVTGALERVCVMFSTKIGMVIESGSPPELTVVDFRLSAAQPLPPDLPSELLPGYDNDPWLRLEAIEILERGGALAAVIAAGVILRLSELTDDDREAVAHLGDGQVLPVRPVALWFRALGGSVVDEVELAALRSLVPLAGELEHSVAAGVPARAAVLSALQRDDLEGVAWLLAGAGRPSFGAALRSLDAQVGSPISAAHPGSASDSERLRRAAEAQPGVWWTDLVYSEE